MMRIFFIILFFLNFSSKVFAQPVLDPQYGCKLQAQEISTEANRILAENNKIFPTEYLYESDNELNFFGNRLEESEGSIRYEGFLRPEDSFQIDIIQGLLGLDLDKDHDVLYLCMYYDAQVSYQSHISLYFLRGNKLSGEHSAVNWIEEKIWGQSLDIEPATISYTGILNFPRFFKDIMGRLPVFNYLYGLFNGIILDTSNLIFRRALQILDQEVERIVITESGVDIASKITNKNRTQIQLKHYFLKPKEVIQRKIKEP